MAIVNMPAVVGTPSLQLWLCLAAIGVGYLVFGLANDPLRKYPGPVAARFTSLYGAFYVLRRDLHLVTARLHDKYGPVVRIAPKRLIFNSPAVWQDIYNNPRVMKGEAYLQLRARPDGPPTVFTSLTKEEHKAKARMIAPILSESSMKSFEPEVSRQIDNLLLALLRASRQSEAVNMSNLSDRLLFDTMAMLSFSYHINTQSDATHRALITGLKARVNRMSLFFFYPALRRLLFVYDLLGIQALGGAVKSMRTIMAARMKMPADARRDFYALVSKQLGAEHTPTAVTPQLWSEAVFFVTAGGGTTSIALSGVFFYLSCNPEAYSRLASEIRTRFTGAGSEIQGPRLVGCEYLTAVIQETMRMSPSVLEYTWRQQHPASVASGESFVVDGHVIPPGTQVAVSNYSMQHDETLFPEPYKFKPERWLELKDHFGQGKSAEQQRVSRAAMKRAFAPFSIGDRACTGQPMAWLELRQTVARALWYFDFKRAPTKGSGGGLGAGVLGRTDGRGRVDEYQLYTGVAVEHTGPELVFTPRCEYWKELEERAKGGNQAGVL